MKNIAVLMPADARPFELSIFCEVFGVDRSADGLPAFDFEIVSERPGVPILMAGGLRMTATAALERFEEADLVAVAPSTRPSMDISPALRDALHSVVDRGGRVMAICSGAFTLAAAGLLEGRQAVTHWMHTDALADAFPNVRVQRDVLYVDEDPIFTSAGAAAGIDLCLHLVRKDHGSAVASAIARRMIVAPHRAGDQAQRLQVAVPPVSHDDGIDALLDWALENLNEDLSIGALAKRTFMSPRSFIRRFGSLTGTSPYAWVVDQRIRLAQRILEEDPEAKVSDIAVQVGFRTSAILRDHFRRKFGCSPSDYRSMFAAAQQQDIAMPTRARALAAR